MFWVWNKQGRHKHSSLAEVEQRLGESGGMFFRKEVTAIREAAALNLIGNGTYALAYLVAPPCFGSQG